VIRWLKKQLKLDHLISYSPRGVILQSVIALIVYGLLVLYNQGQPLSIARLRRQIRVDLHQALHDWAYHKGYQAALTGHSGTDPPEYTLLSPPSQTQLPESIMKNEKIT